MRGRISKDLFKALEAWINMRNIFPREVWGCRMGDRHTVTIFTEGLCTSEIFLLICIALKSVRQPLMSFQVWYLGNQKQPWKLNWEVKNALTYLALCSLLTYGHSYFYLLGGSYKKIGYYDSTKDILSWSKTDKWIGKWIAWTCLYSLSTLLDH